jgi:hypothetical protein
MKTNTQLTITQPKQPATNTRHKTRTCPTCQQTMITGPDARTAAIIVDLDPTALSYPQALACIVTNRRMYTISNSGDIRPHTPNKHLHHQNPYPIHTAHQCRQPIPKQNPNPEPLPEIADDERPPF